MLCFVLDFLGGVGVELGALRSLSEKWIKPIVLEMNSHYSSSALPRFLLLSIIFQ